MAFPADAVVTHRSVTGSAVTQGDVQVQVAATDKTVGGATQQAVAVQVGNQTLLFAVDQATALRTALQAALTILTG